MDVPSPVVTSVPAPTIMASIDTYLGVIEARTNAIRQTTAFANYVKQVEQVMSETHE